MIDWKEITRKYENLKKNWNWVVCSDNNISYKGMQRCDDSGKVICITTNKQIVWNKNGTVNLENSDFEMLDLTHQKMKNHFSSN